jgi:hypothetical protein
MQAVVPAPDGGYPGANTAEKENAILSLTTGGFNTAVGWLSMRSETTGSFNTAVGAGTLFRNNAEENTAIGIGALLSKYRRIRKYGYRCQRAFREHQRLWQHRRRC